MSQRCRSPRCSPSTVPSRHRVGQRAAGQAPWSAPPAKRNAATGKDRKLAAARPSAASSAIQQKMMPSPRAKFSAKPPSAIQHLHAVLEREQAAPCCWRWRNAMVSTPLSSNRFGGISKLVEGVRREAHGLAVPQVGVLRGTPTCHRPSKVPEGLWSAELNLMRSCSGLSRRGSWPSPGQSAMHAT